MLESYNNYLKTIADQLAKVQVGRTYLQQWPCAAPICNLYLEPDWVVKCTALLLDSPETLRSKHSNFIAHFFYPLISKHILFDNFTKSEILIASKNLYTLLKQIRVDPACSNFENVHKHTENLESTFTNTVDKKYMEVLGYLDAISEMMSPIYRGLTIEIHGPYNNMCVRDYFLHMGILEKRLHIRILEKCTRPPQVDFFGHVISPEQVSEYSLFLGDTQTDVISILSLLKNVFEDVKKYVETKSTRELCSLVARQLESVGLTITLSHPDERIISKTESRLFLVNSKSEIYWAKYIYEHTLNHLKE